MSPQPSIQEIVVDCADPNRLAEFWGTLLEARWAASAESGWGVVEADPILIAFQRVPEPKPGPKNRLHLDIAVPDAAAAVARAVELGATRTGQGELIDADGNHVDVEQLTGDGYVVMLDPEQNEFCFVIDNRGQWRAMINSLLEVGGHIAGS